MGTQAQRHIRGIPRIWRLPERRRKQPGYSLAQPPNCPRRRDHLSAHFVRRDDGQRNSRGQRNRGMKTSVRRGHFIDVKTLASALLAKGFSLAKLSKFLNVPSPKLEFDAFDGPITDVMLRYAVRDVQATWECYADLIARYGALKLTQTNPEKIYSEAGIGKGYIREMGIVPWRKAQPELSTGFARHDYRHLFRRAIRSAHSPRNPPSDLVRFPVDVSDRSARSWDCGRFVIAEGMTWQDATAEARDFLASVNLDALQSQSTWQQLITLVRVQPEADIFPVRAAYSGEAQKTIGTNWLTTDAPTMVHACRLHRCQAADRARLHK